MERFKQPENRDEGFYREMSRLYLILGNSRYRFLDPKEKDKILKFLNNSTEEEVQKVKRLSKFLDNLLEIRSKNTTPEKVILIEKNMEDNPELKEYIDSELPSCLVEDYVHWTITTQELPEDLSQVKDNGETYKDGFERFSLSDYQIKKLFGYVGNRDKEIKEGFEEQYGTVIGSPDDSGSYQVKELEVKSRAWEEYKEFQDLANYLKGNADAELEDSINNKLIEDKNFRMFFERIKQALGK